MAKRKLKIALIFGGTSKERDVSLRSGATAAKYLNPKKYDVVPIEISETGKWLTTSPTIRQISKEVATDKVTTRELVPIDENSKGKIDVAVLVLHGPGGEDGTIQGMLELLNIPYTCSGVLASALAMDKARTKAFLSSLGIMVPPGILIEKQEFIARKKHFLQRIKGKVVVKPNRIGSSLGVSIVAGQGQIKKAVTSAFRHGDEILVEKFIQGTELTVPVLGNSKPTALPVIEIVPLASSFFDYKAKYAVGGSDEIVPARIPDRLAKQVQSLALKAHLALGCRGMTRSDFILDKTGLLYFLEINTIPGMTPQSLVPKSAAYAGISYSQLLDILIKLAQEKK
ncbi:MAG TPA: D-alanine--D-alanine ligase [Patescibacteria group bacterium]|jgi:D-alanine-D-alanine ligase|nr:D-alanine--D-alanine ligase [Patescibacteria group bacterium]